MAHEISDGAAGSRAGGRVLSAVELHARVPIRTRTGGRAGDAVEEFCVALAEIRLRGRLRDGKPRRDFERSERNDTERHSGRDGLNGQARIEVADREPEHGGDGVRRVDVAEGGIVLAHGTVDTEAFLPRGEGHGDGADLEIEGDRLSAGEDGMVEIQPAGSAERGVAGELEFFANREEIGK